MFSESSQIKHFTHVFCVSDDRRMWPFLKRRLHPPEGAFVRLFQLTDHYMCESKAYYNNLHLTKNNGQIYNC